MEKSDCHFLYRKQTTNPSDFLYRVKNDPAFCIYRKLVQSLCIIKNVSNLVSIKISVQCIYMITYVLIQEMVWRQFGAKPFLESMTLG